MNPADECNAFLAFSGDNASIAEVARRFGLTERHVAGRLRLATLAPDIFEKLQTGEMTLDIAKVYAATSDHTKQLFVFERYGCAATSGYTADHIRRAIQNGGMKGNSPIAILVGQDAYTAAGGRIDADLFSDKDDAIWLDPEIADTLAAACMEAAAHRMAAETGLGWVRPVASDNIWEFTRDFHRVNVPMREATAEENDRLVAIGAEVDAIDLELEDPDTTDERAAELEANYTALDTEAGVLANREALLPDDWKPHVGRFLKLSATGEIVLDPTIYSETPLRIAAGDDDGELTASPGPQGDRTTPISPVVPTTAAAPGGKALSQKLFDRLAIQRRDVLAASILHNHGLALDFMIFTLASPHKSLGSGIKSSRQADPGVGGMPVTPTLEILASAQDQLDKT